MSAFNADALMASPSWKSMARTVLLSRRVLNSPFGSLSWAPFGNVSLTAFLRASPMQTIPSSQPSCGLCHLSVGMRMRRSFRRFAADAQHPADRRAQFLVLAVDAAKPTTPPPLPLQQLGLQSLDVLAPRFCFLWPEHPADRFIAGKRGEVFPRSGSGRPAVDARSRSARGADAGSVRAGRHPGEQRLGARANAPALPCRLSAGGLRRCDAGSARRSAARPKARPPAFTVGWKVIRR